MLVVRHGQVEDAQRVLELWSMARSEQATTSDRRGDLKRLITETPSALFVAEADDGSIVGALIAGWDGWRGTCTGSRSIRTTAGWASGGGCSTPARHTCASSGRDGSRRWSRTTTRSPRPFWDAADYPYDRQIGRRVRNL